MAQQCRRIEDGQPIEMFGIVRRLPMTINLVAGGLDVYELLEHAHDETITSFFGLVERKLEITFEQFFMGCAEPAQLTKGRFGSIGWHRRVIGFVRRDGGLWTLRREEWSHFESDAPGVVHRERNPGDLVLAPVFQ